MRLPSPSGIAVTGTKAVGRTGKVVADKSPHWLRATGILALLTLAGLGVLLVLDAALKSGLWGEWAFALVVCWLGIWLIGRGLHRWLRFRPPQIWQALILAGLPLVGAPFAALTWWPGVVLFVGALIMLLLVLLWWVPWNAPEILQPIHWLPVLAAIVAIWAYVAVGNGPTTPAMAGATQPVPDALELAYAYRPLLFFDSRENYFPMNIARAMQDGLVEQCTYGITGPNCDEVDAPQDVDLNDDYLAVDSGALGARSATGGKFSALYVHASRKDRAVYLDYWVYYAENPNPLGNHFLCAPGLQWSELTCFDHAGDWEGLVVVLEPCSRSAGIQSTCRSTDEGRLRIVAVEYAAHRGLTRFSWNTLIAGWRKAKLGNGASERPLAFVALDSHASYPHPCGAPGSFNAIFEGLGCGPDVADGKLAWGENSAAECGKSCLHELPITSDGAPTGWDAFAGHWG
ncbi:MAG TPA: hypothetical protein VLW49_03235, partial [Gaiellaceae bacterium]|nr:hypothetical protein [Gaiellaceae bacterium]